MRRLDYNRLSNNERMMSRTSLDRSVFLLLLLWIGLLSTTASAQFDDEVTVADSPQVQKVLSVIELAKMAAELDQPDVSFEAIRRIVLAGPVINKVDLGGLLSSPPQNGSANFSRNSGSPTPQQQTSGKVAAKMIQVSELWVEKKFDPQRAFDTWFEQVFPKDSPNVIHLHSSSKVNQNQNSFGGFSLSTNASKLPVTGAQCMIDWGIRAGKVDAIEQELTKRLLQPGNADLGWLFKIWIADAKKDDAVVYESILAEIEPKLATQIVGINADIRTNAIREAIKKLPQNSELKTRLKKSFLKALPTSSNWNSNPINTSFLCEVIMESIDANDVDSADEIAEAVISQWNAVRQGNDSWVRSMESQAFRELAGEAFDKGAFKIGSVWMQRTSMSQNDSNDELELFRLRNETTQQWLRCPQDIRFGAFAKQIWTAPMLGLGQMSAMMPQFLTSSIFRKDGQSRLPLLANANSLSGSALEWLMRDAIALGKQAEIEKKILELAESKSDDLTLAKLVWSRANDQPLDLKSLIVTNTKEGAANEAASLRRLAPADSAPLPLEVEFAELAMREPATKELGIDLANRLLESCLKHNKTALMSQCRSILHAAKNVSGKTLVTHEHLKHFVEATDWDGGAVLDGIPSKAVWLPRNESRSSWGHETSLMQSYLFLKYPLAGDFDIEFKARDGSYGEPGVAIGGILTEFCPYNKTVALSSIGYRHMGGVSKRFEEYKQGDWNEYHIKRNANEFQVSINGKSAVSIPSSKSATPFFALGAQSYRSSTFDELKITGNVQIPRHVELCSPRLAGWSSYYTTQLLEPVQLMESVNSEPSEPSSDPFGNEESNESQEPYDFESVESQTFPIWYGLENGDADYAWRYNEGVLESVDQQLAREARLEELEAGDDSLDPQVRQALGSKPKKPRTIGLIYYERPLCDGETLELDFYQDSKPEHIEGKSRTLPVSLSPVIGRTAVLLDQPEIALRWIAGAGEQEWLGTDPNQRILDPNAVQVAKANLKERDWNSFMIRYTKEWVTISINGQKVYERKWETSVSPQFGLYHQLDQSQVRVRNVRLTGDWPEKLPDLLFEVTN